MIDVTQDIYSLTSFKRNSLDLMKRMKKTGRPLVLTVNGKAEAVLLNAKDYQHVAEHLDAIANIHQGLLEAERGLGQPAKEVFEEIRRETRSGK
jgi:prevent-host-death family protein